MYQRVSKAMDEIRKRAPLIHIIPNQVTAGFMADAVAAVGARPIMAVNPMEFEDITGHAEALVINLGQLNEEKIEAAKKALEVAKARKRLVTIDPVGISASEYRKREMLALIGEDYQGIIKGNSGELHCLQTGQLSYEGVDSLHPQRIKPPSKAGQVYVVSGATDWILSNEETVRLKKEKGTRYSVVGTGCVAGALCGVFQSVTKDSFFSAICAMSLLGFVIEQANAMQGYGTYKQGILDGLSRMEGKEDEFRTYLEKTYERRENPICNR